MPGNNNNAGGDSHMTKPHQPETPPRTTTVWARVDNVPVERTEDVEQTLRQCMAQFRADYAATYQLGTVPTPVLQMSNEMTEEQRALARKEKNRTR